jgi:N-acetylglutamate synthase-like GNAT family acetyltransferase
MKKHTDLKIIIRKANIGDAPEVAEVLEKSFLEFEDLYTTQAFRATAADRENILKRMQEGPVWIASLKGKIVGTISATFKEDDLYVRGMAVIPAARDLRIGCKLLENAENFALINGCRRIFLHTTRFLRKAIRLYQYCGYKPIKKSLHDYYGIPVYTMEKTLKS